MRPDAQGLGPWAHAQKGDFGGVRAWLFQLNLSDARCTSGCVIRCSYSTVHVQYCKVCHRTGRFVGKISASRPLCAVEHRLLHNTLPLQHRDL
jgi:hypothetical protein